MIQLTVKGKPSHVRHLANDPEYLFAMEFHFICSLKLMGMGPN